LRYRYLLPVSTTGYYLTATAVHIFNKLFHDKLALQPSRQEATFAYHCSVTALTGYGLASYLCTPFRAERSKIRYNIYEQLSSARCPSHHRHHCCAMLVCHRSYLVLRHSPRCQHQSKHNLDNTYLSRRFVRQSLRRLRRCIYQFSPPRVVWTNTHSTTMAAFVVVSPERCALFALNRR
jgi:hypothetical protein